MVSKEVGRILRNAYYFFWNLNGGNFHKVESSREDIMIIKSSYLNMNATHSYISRMKTSEEYQNVSTASDFYSSMEQSMGKNLFENHTTSDKDKDKEEKTASKTNQNEWLKPIVSERAEKIQLMQQSYEKNNIRRQVLIYLLRALFGNNEELMKKIEEAMNVNAPSYMETSYEEFMYEEETTHVSTIGKVVTTDGREIEFDIDVAMSRSFEGYYKAAGTFCIDPLVINTASSITEVGKQIFYFDLDVDGELEEISTLGSGSGFLALDKNEDGIINDGSELFGTLSGDGFADLAKYDLDQNGWIDEADEIFKKLKIWYADGSGEAKLLTLKEAGIGAIALKRVNSEFALTNESNNPNAYIRKTGMFLYEDGMAGTIQHVDLVKKGA